MDAIRVSSEEDTMYKLPDVLVVSETTLVTTLPAAPTQKTFTTAEVAMHDSPDSLYLTIHGKVYDMTEFQHTHPGGKKILQKVAGKDATKQFQKYHRDGILLSHEEKVVGVVPEEKLVRRRGVFGWMKGKS